MTRPRFNPADFDEYAHDLPGASRSGSATEGNIRIDAELSLRVQALLQNKRVGALFRGTGKPEIGEGGHPLDASSSGYDYSLLLSLAKHGVRDESELATALSHRPDGEARNKGVVYITRTVRKVLAFVGQLDGAAGGQQECQANFEVERVCIFGSDRSLFELTIHGKTLQFRSAELLSKPEFTRRYMDAFHRIPSLPKEWDELVNSWMERAEVVELPEDASDAVALSEAVEAAVAGLTPGEKLEDLDRGLALSVEGKGLVFKTSAITKALRDDFPHLRRTDLCVDLRKHHTSQGIPIEGVKTRVWARRAEHEDAREGQNE